MTAGVLALVSAVVLAVAYVALSERFSYSTIHRRQLDVWVAVGSLVCLGVMLYGAADAHRELRSHRLAVDGSGGPPRQVVYRIHQPNLRTVADLVDEPALVDSLPAAPAADEAAGMSLPAARSESGGAGRGETDAARSASESGQDNLSEAEADEVVPTAILSPPESSTADLPPIPQPSLTPTFGPIRVETMRPEPNPTFTPPATAMEPTSEPTRLSSPTPHCGDPEDIRLRVERLDTSLDRGGSKLVVEYRARIRNESTFPATMADVVITALNHDAGSEQFGHDTRPDVTLQPGAVITLEGTLTLTKMPPPFGSTDLCISFVGETCGRRPPYRVTRHCTTVRGF